MAEKEKQANPLKLYNTLGKKVEVFKSQKPKVVKMYACGPTVYNTPTLGNLRTYLNVDFLRRTFEYFGYKVDEVVNITDIEDKIIRDSAKAGLNPEDKAQVKKFTEKYEKIFFENLAELNIEKAEHNPHATDPDVIKKMIEIIQALLSKGYAYVTDDGVFFSLSKLADYGKLSKVDLAGIKEGARIDADEYDKENARDFALWKAAKKGEPAWDAPFGAGRPGWHIECSAMANIYLGETVDVHAGAVDLIFPHHENEVAQSESYTGKKFVNYWFHPEHLLIEGQRMGKSLGNFYTLEDLHKKFNIEPLAFRMLALGSHYRDKLNFTHSSIQDAENTLNNLRAFVLRLQAINNVGTADRISNVIKKSKEEFRSALADDLAMPKALAAVFNFIKKVNTTKDLNTKEAADVLKTILEFDQVLGLELKQISVTKIPDSVIVLAKKREQAREIKDWDEADNLRNQIEAKGFEVEDTPDGPVVRKK
jgi:cysteinyl-tRNA synthetase